MTFEQLVRAVHASSATYLSENEIKALKQTGGLSIAKVEKIIAETFGRIHAEVLDRNGEITIPNFGRFLTTKKRSQGVKPNGTRWSVPGRTQLALKASPTASVKGEPKKSVGVPFAEVG